MVVTLETKVDLLVSLVTNLQRQNEDIRRKLEDQIMLNNNLNKQMGDLYRLYFSPVNTSEMDVKAKFRSQLYAPKKVRVN